MREAPPADAREAPVSDTRLARRMLFALVGFSSLITGIITTIDLCTGYFRDLRAIEQAFEFIESSSAPTLSLSVWQLDKDLVQSQLDGLLRLRDVEFASIDSGDMHWTAGQATASRQIKSTVSLTYLHGEQREVIGTLQVIANGDHPLQRVWERALADLLSNGIKTTLVAVFLLVTFHRTITQHLAKTAGFVRRIDPSHPIAPDQALVLDRPPGGRWRPDILDTLADSINALLASLKHAQEDLQTSHHQLSDSELRFRLGMEAAGAGLWDCHMVYEQIFGTAECARILGLQTEDLRPELAFWRRLVHPDDLPAAEAAVREHLAGASANLRIECRVRHARDGWRWMSVRGRVVQREADGQAVRAMGTLIDIDARKRAEAALSEREEKFRGIAEMNVDLIVQTDERGQLKYVSPSARMLLRQEPATLLGQPFTGLVVRQQRGEANRLLRQVFDGQTLRHVALQALASDGKAFPIEAHLTPLWIEGQVVGAQGVLRDMTERQQAEDALRRNEARLRALTEHTQALIYEVDREGRVTFANRDRPPPQPSVVGTVPADEFPPQQRALCFETLHRALADGSRQTAELSLPDPEGGRRDYLVTVAPIGGRGASTATVTAHDITELRQAEEALRSLNRELEVRVRERTAALEEARDEAQRANRAKAEFLSRMSHELRTPLNSILGFAQLLIADESLGERQRKELRIMQESGQHLLALINDILDLARIDAARMELYPTDVVLADVLEAVANMVRVSAELKGLRFVPVFEAGLPAAVRVDHQRLRQILLNLLSNAIKFTDQGSVSLRVSLLPAPAGAAEGQCCLRFEVEDTGIGLAPEAMAHLFEPFEQMAAPQRRRGGSGLGLAISRQFVRLMGADIRVDSEPGRGSRFWFDLPLETVDVGIGRQPPAAPRPPSGYDGPRRTVLVVDDVRENREVLSDSLEALGFDVLTAADARSAIELARSRRPALIIMDAVMPVMDGLQAVRELKRHRPTADIPVIIASANATPEMQADSRAAGASAFLAKPLELPALVEAVGRLLALRWRQAAAAEIH